MPAPWTSLRRIEASQRAGLLAVDETRVELDLAGSAPTFESTTTITFQCREPGASTFLDLKADRVLSATLNDRPLAPDDWTSGRLRLRGLQPLNTARVTARFRYSADGEGLHRHVDPADGGTYLYAMSFLDAGPKWFACFDQPDLKSRYELLVRATEDWTVLGNGPSQQVGRGEWRIVPSAPLSSYFVTLVAGPYASVYDEHDGIRLGLHVRGSMATYLAAEAPDLLEVTKACFDYYHRIFGVRYPFGEYHQAFVPDFNFGAMENPGCVTLRDPYIYRTRATAAERASRAGVMAHEMAHMWFGNLVTMTWWDDLWLNESFAEYLGHRACSESTRYPLWTEFGVVRKDWGAVADQSRSTHPVAGNGSADAATALQDFDGISYAKGAAVLKQLVAYLSDEVFLAGLRDYFQRHRFGNADFTDLIEAWRRAGAVELEDWAAAWLQTSGMDTLTVTDGHLLRRPPGPSRRPHAVDVGYVDAHGNPLGSESVLLREDAAALNAPPGTALTVPDAGDDTWARIRFGDVPWPAVTTAAARTDRGSMRVVVWNSVRDAVRNTELDPGEALDLVCGLLPAEPSDVALAAVLTFARNLLAGPYVAPNRRPGMIERVRECAAALVAAAADGSDRQLAAFRILVTSTSDPGRLRDWLRARGLPAGLGMDVELAWSVVTRLAVLTGDEEVIRGQLAVDPSAAGREHAARAQAASADPAAKQRAWRLLVEPSEVGALELYATAAGFFAAEQDELCAPYVGRYFEEIPETARFRTGWVLGRVALQSYPAPYSLPQVLAQAEACLGRPDLAPAVRRSVLDGTDTLQRAVRSRQRYE